MNKQEVDKLNKQLDHLKAENKKLKDLIKGNEEICRQRNNELELHKAAAKAAKSGLSSDLKAYLELIKSLKKKSGVSVRSL